MKARGEAAAFVRFGRTAAATAGPAISYPAPANPSTSAALPDLTEHY